MASRSAGIALEVCVENAEDAATAAAGGARRLELCGALTVGGVTPSVGLVECVVAESACECVALVRPRGGDFLFTARERSSMLRDVERLREAGVAGVAIGALTREARLDTTFLGELIAAAAPCYAVLHRAFDATDDLEFALETACELGLRRILTSGGARDAPRGAQRLAQLVERARGRIEILPGGGIRAANVVDLVRTSGVDQVHASCGVKRMGAMLQRPEDLVLGSSERGDSGTWRVDPVELHALVAALRDFPSIV